MLIDTIQKNVSQRSHTPIWRFPEERKDFQITELWDLAKRYASIYLSLGIKPGDRVGLVLHNNSDYVAYLLGLWMIDGTAVPLPPSAGNKEGFPLFIRKVHNNCQFALILLADEISDEMMKELSSEINCRVYKSAQLKNHEPTETIPEMKHVYPDAITLIQYSSGSTGDPKGVIVTHSMVMNQLQYLDLEYRTSCKSLGVTSSASWLPFHHDMGLFIGILQPLFLWCNNLLASPRYFMYKPKRWFTFLSEHQVDLNFMTNLAMANSFASLCKLDHGSIDLSNLFIYFGAEKVSPYVLRKTYEQFEHFNMPQTHFKIGYGMAENSLGAVSTKNENIKIIRAIIKENSLIQITENKDHSMEFVSLGRPQSDMVVSIHDEAGKELPELCLGEIYVEGKCVTPGYYNNPQATAKALSAGKLRTGDLGFFFEGQLYFHSRKDDMIIIGGRNIAPDDIEDCVETMDNIHRGTTALISMDNASNGKTDLVLLVEKTNSCPLETFLQIKQTIQSVIFEKCGLLLNKIVLCNRHSIEKTTSGKKRRKVIGRRFKQQELDLIHAK